MIFFLTAFLTITLVLIIILIIINQKKSKLIDQLNDEFETVERIVQKLLHDAKNPLATASMAMHNLKFVLNQNFPDSLTDESINDFLDSSHEAIDETTKRIKFAEILCQADTSKYKPLDIGHIIESIAEETNESFKIETDIKFELPQITSEPQVLVMLLQKICELALNNSNNRQVIHLKAERNNENLKKIKLSVYNHLYLSNQVKNNISEKIAPPELPGDKNQLYTIVARILTKHNSKLKGTYSSKLGGYWQFNLS